MSNGNGFGSLGLSSDHGRLDVFSLHRLVIGYPPMIDAL
jgi:hypothetical protein